jgi:DNA replication protein DnaC
MVTYRAPFVGNLVPKSLIDTVSSAILTKYVPLPQGPNAAAGTLTSNYLNPFHGYRVSRSPALKIDENITSAARLSFTYSDSHTESPVQALGGLGEGFPEPITANAGTFQGSPTFRLNFDDTLTPSMILHVGVGFQEFNFCSCPRTLDYNAASDIGLTGATLAQTTFPRMGVTSAGAAGGLAVTSPQLGGMNTLGPGGAKNQQAERHPTSSASLTWVHGNHTFKFGGDFRKDYFVTFNTSNTPGTFSFGAATAGRRRKQAGFRDPDRTLDNFDFTFNPKMNRSLVFDLATVAFIGKREDALFLGPGGTGKSHLAQAIGQAAIQQGYKVLYRETHILLDELAEAVADGTRREYMESVATVPLLIIDDFGMRKLPHTAAEDLLEIIMRRYERVSTLLTSNRPVEDWGKLLGDVAAVSAMLDRLLHHGHVLKCGPRSWRTKTAPAS